MKRSTVIRHLTELATEAQRLSRLPDDLRPRLTELWIAGDILEGADGGDWIPIVGRLNLPADELPYLSLHPQAAWCEDQLRLNKRPTSTEWRANDEPAWNHEIRPVARFWSITTGTDELLIKHLGDRSVTETMIESPTRDQLRSALHAALPRSERHLAEVLDEYWDPDWRRRHTGYGIHPDDHLWRAAEAVRSIRDALTAQD